MSPTEEARPRGASRARRIAVAVALTVAASLAGLVAAVHRPFPSDRTPEGAYVRIAHGVTDGQLQVAFPYLETEAQWACFTVRENRKKALELVRRSYPAEERAALEHDYAPYAAAADGPDIFVLYAKERGWDRRLRRDLSGATSVEEQGERASVVTARGTRYAFRRRDNGIWGLTMFTADLVAEAERSARDLAVVEKAAADYERARR